MEVKSQRNTRHAIVAKKNDVPDFRGNALNFSPLRIMCAEGLSYIAFIMLRYVPSIPDFWMDRGA